ncbi:Formamidopyrimidine-DNA glycosylase [Hyphomicrobium sulfonivorans]|uniref:Formamidopyrimidine-DNA glycosylase n=1 Tax=Hyphomicrobium sulfonivorans TaxID=121290 RepID=A0A109BLE0_HYPSL|nr:bifunctional DNA-formamidopyrimidine glycosylase/DNA-(apurinic or apyrimidinic site) lyase [Hyphomicrobium sulfonivorans]KWT70931.1 Formamidopyrimidine-DNA glycosylase [Hyphomicrobium sulfonivorans]
MPELPEVETVRRGLVPAMVGHAIEHVEQRRPDLRFPLPQNFAGRLEGRTIERLERRGKYLLAHLSDGALLLMHLGMTGSFLISHSEKARGKKISRSGKLVAPTSRGTHDHVVFHMSDGATVTYNDPRRFGFMLLVEPEERDTHPMLRQLGIEPLGEELTAAHLAAKAHGKRTDLKAFLLDQRIIAGLGNIYVCEALYRAHLLPTRGTATIATATGKPTAKAEALVTAIRDVLNDAIGAGGSSLRDYRHTDGKLGYFQHRFAVYNRAGKKCPREGCGGTIERLVQSGRSTFYCPRCQR